MKLETMEVKTPRMGASSFSKPGSLGDDILSPAYKPARRRLIINSLENIELNQNVQLRQPAERLGRAAAHDEHDAHATDAGPRRPDASSDDGAALNARAAQSRNVWQPGDVRLVAPDGPATDAVT